MARAVGIVAVAFGDGDLREQAARAAELGFDHIDAHIDAIAPFLLQYKVGGGGVEHLRPERATAQEVSYRVATVTQCFDGFKRECATATYHNMTCGCEMTLHGLIIGNGT